MKHKRIICISVITMLFIQSVFVNNAVFADTSQREIKVLLNDKNIDFDVLPQIIDGRTLVPLRAIFEALGYNVKWYGSEERIEATSNDNTIILYIGDKNIKFNKSIIATDVPPQIIDGRTLVPIRVIAECSGCIVDWDDVNSAVIIKTPTDKYISSDDKTTASDKDQPITNKDKEKEVTEPEELSCKASLRKSLMSIGGNYKIVFSVIVEGSGGDGEYMYRYEISQNNKISKKSNFSKENSFEGELNGSGECILTVFVKDKGGNIAEKEFVLTE